MRLIAHRGASGYAPENTLASFRIALEMGARELELDVHETSDSRIVVIHDESLRRTAGLKALVSSLPYSQAAVLDAGEWYDRAFKGERVPLLEQVFALAKGRAEVHVEVKGLGSRPGGERRLLDLLKRTGWMKAAVVSSFHPAILRKLRELDAHVRLGWLVSGGPLAQPARVVQEAKAIHCEGVHLSQQQADARWVQLAHKAGMKVLVYTVNEAKDVERLKTLGVDGVFTNYPDLLSRHWVAVGGTD